MSFLQKLKAAKDSLNADLQRRVGRFKNETFLKATMASAALIVAADGKIEDSEVEATAEFINTHPALSCFEPAEKQALFEAYVKKAGSVMSKIELMGYVSKAKGNTEMATTVIEVAVALAAADGDVADSEKKAIEKIAVTLGLDPSAYSA